jgi:serine/threonine-protein kinase
MTAGDVPFPGQSAADVISKHLTEPVTPPRVKNPLISGPVDWVIVKMMQKAREDRYQTPNELVKDLESISAGGMPDGYAQEVEEKSSTLPKLRRSRLIRRASRFRRR